mmetsp:Transcript_19773/g.41567  ORF Transcript_19773/g.41567 Transcript_19773/m.41567 type:complete len:86 (+) Transcript_19773:807-1064(+)
MIFGVSIEMSFREVFWTLLDAKHITDHSECINPLVDVETDQVLCEYNLKLAIYADSSQTPSLNCYSRGNRNRFVAFSTKDKPNNL